MMLYRQTKPGAMLVRPSSAIRSDYKAFSQLCRETDEPIIITNNGENDLVVMSHEAFCRREAWLRLQMKLDAADKQIEAGKLVEHDEVFNRLKERVRDEV